MVVSRSEMSGTNQRQAAVILLRHLCPKHQPAVLRHRGKRLSRRRIIPFLHADILQITVYRGKDGNASVALLVADGIEGCLCRFIRRDRLPPLLFGNNPVLYQRIRHVVIALCLLKGGTYAHVNVPVRHVPGSKRQHRLSFSDSRPLYKGRIGIRKGNNARHRCRQRPFITLSGDDTPARLNHFRKGFGLHRLCLQPDSLCLLYGENYLAGAGFFFVFILMLMSFMVMRFMLFICMITASGKGIGANRP
ncbi:hypothetical protein Barb7_03083 [Bacteroidales bacterium Barb7]|nr:hypothetical protein Barb7_03083 [Bacteroidales bacterium Barb7]